MVDVFKPPFFAEGVVVKKHTVVRPDKSVEDGFVVGVMADDERAKAVADALNFTENAGLFLIHVASTIREAIDSDPTYPMSGSVVALPDQIEEFVCG